MESVKNLAVTVVLGLIVLAGLDIVFNGGQTLAVLMPERTAPSASSRQAVLTTGHNEDDMVLQNYSVMPTRPGSIVIDTSQPATVVFVEPQIVTATPSPLPLVVTNTPTAPVTDFGATATAFFAPTATVNGSDSLGHDAVCHGGRSCPRATATPAVGR